MVCMTAGEAGPAGVTRGEGSRLTRQERAFLGGALKSRAFAVWRGKDLTRLIDYDVRLFFGFSTVTALAVRRRRAAAAKRLIAKATVLGVDGASELAVLADHLTQRFWPMFVGNRDVPAVCRGQTGSHCAPSSH
jgi:hypothetical protein